MSSSAEPSLSSRRDFIAGLTVGAAMVGGGASPALAATRAAPASTGAVDLERAGIEEWRRHVGSDFVARVDGRGTALRLVAVEAAHSGGRLPSGVTRSEAFAAVFEPRSGVMRGDRIYAVSDPAGGLMPIYFSPAAGNGRMVALFN